MGLKTRAIYSAGYDSSSSSCVAERGGVGMSTIIHSEENTLLNKSSIKKAHKEYL